MQSWELNPGLHALGKHYTNWAALLTLLSIFCIHWFVLHYCKEKIFQINWADLSVHSVRACVCVRAWILLLLFFVSPNSTSLLGPRRDDTLSRCKRQRQTLPKCAKSTVPVKLTHYTITVPVVAKGRACLISSKLITVTMLVKAQLIKCLLCAKNYSKSLLGSLKWYHKIWHFEWREPGSRRLYEMP